MIPRTTELLVPSTRERRTTGFILHAKVQAGGSLWSSTYYEGQPTIYERNRTAVEPSVVPGDVMQSFDEVIAIFLREAR